MNKYLSTHSGSSARTSDLWRALDTGSSPSVAEVMDQWTTLQGICSIDSPGFFYCVGFSYGLYIFKYDKCKQFKSYYFG